MIKIPIFGWPLTSANVTGWTAAGTMSNVSASLVDVMCMYRRPSSETSQATLH